MNNVQELKQSYAVAEREQRDMLHRAEWLERRMPDAPDTKTYEEISAELLQLEDDLNDKGHEVTQKRRAWVQAEIAANPMERPHMPLAFGNCAVSVK